MQDFGRYTSASSRKRRRKRVFFAPVLAVLVACVGLFFAGGAFSGLSLLGGDPKELAQRKDLSDGAINVLAVGTDERPDGESEDMGVRADTLMLARVFPGTGEVRLLSIPRDLFVEISPDMEDRINAAYASGGAGQSVRAVENYTGVDIDNRAVVDFEGFEDVVDAVGGVEVDVREGEYPAGSGIEAGPQRLDGEQALFYARYRGTSGGDLDRIDRQQQILAALRKQTLAPGSMAKLPEITRVASENIETDLDLEDSIALGKTLLGRGGEAPLETGQLSGEPTTLPDGREVLIPDDEGNQRLIRRFLR